MGERIPDVLERGEFYLGGGGRNLLKKVASKRVYRGIRMTDWGWDLGDFEKKKIGTEIRNRGCIQKKGASALITERRGKKIGVVCAEFYVQRRISEGVKMGDASIDNQQKGGS